MTDVVTGNHLDSRLYDIKDFLKTIQKKDLYEILSLADREATAAWRSAYRLKKSGNTLDELPSQYEYALKELVRFLRAAVTYRPLKIDPQIFDRFVQLRETISA